MKDVVLVLAPNKVTHQMLESITNIKCPQLVYDFFREGLVIVIVVYKLQSLYYSLTHTTGITSFCTLLY